MNTNVFREYDIRGVVSHDLIAELVIGLGRALGTFFIRNNAFTMVLGRIIRGDQLLLIFARSILADSPGVTFISEVKGSQVLYQEIEHPGGRYSLNDIDGVQVDMPGGGDCVRASTTRPALVMCFESLGFERLNEIRREIETRVCGLLSATTQASASVLNC